MYIYIISLAPELLVARAAGALLQKRARATVAPVVSKVLYIWIWIWI